MCRLKKEAASEKLEKALQAKKDEYKYEKDAFLKDNCQQENKFMTARMAWSDLDLENEFRALETRYLQLY